jgi:hypothetical protein
MAGPDLDARRIAAAVAATIEAELAEARRKWLAEMKARTRLEAELDEACRGVGAALDDLKAQRYTRTEQAARRKLELSAARLKAVMARRGKAGGRT